MPAFWVFITSVIVALLPLSANASAAEGIPDWARSFKAPERAGKSCYVGAESQAPSREVGLEAAWKNALVEIARREFPHLIKINETSRESLRQNEYIRDTVLQGDAIRFRGLEEDKESPAIEVLQKGGFAVSRLLCWAQADLVAEKQRQLAEEKNKVPAAASKFEEVLPLGMQATGMLGSLEVVTLPAGATILLQSRPVGVSNASFEKVVPGSYELVLQKDGYEIRREPVIVQAGLRSKVNVTLNRAKTLIYVNSRPAGARILVDNKPTGLKTPSQVSQDVGNKAEFLVEMDDFRAERRSVDVGFTPPNLMFELTMYEGRLSVLTEIPTRGARVFLGDKFLGDAPLWGLSVAGGNYKLKISADGYSDFITNVDIRASRPLAITTRLDPVAPVEEAPILAEPTPTPEATPEPVAVSSPTPQAPPKQAKKNPTRKKKKCNQKDSTVGSFWCRLIENAGSIAEDEIGVVGAKKSAKQIKKETDCLP